MDEKVNLLFSSGSLDEIKNWAIENMLEREVAKAVWERGLPVIITLYKSISGEVFVIKEEQSITRL